MWSDIAANTNLFLGITFVTFFEFLVFLFRYIAGKPEHGSFANPNMRMELPTPK